MGDWIRNHIEQAYIFGLTLILLLAIAFSKIYIDQRIQNKYADPLQQINHKLDTLIEYNYGGTHTDRNTAIISRKIR